jgi:cholesterol 25-hydroxylase
VAQVLVNIIVQQVSPFGGPKHVLSRLLHNIVVTYLLCEAHSGYDLPWMSHRVFPAVFGGSVRHNAHHNKGDCYYQQFFKYIDDAAGFVESSKVVS